MSTKEEIVVGLGRGGWRTVWILFFGFSGAYYWLAELAPLVNWRVEPRATQLAVATAFWALAMRQYYAVQARRIESRRAAEERAEERAARRRVVEIRPAASGDPSGA